MATGHKRIKVLFTIPNFDTAGSGKAMLKIALGLDPMVFEPHVACFHSNGAFFKEVEASGIPIHIFPFTAEMRPLHKGLLKCWRISRFFKRHGFHLIHSFHYGSDYSEALAARLAGIKWVFTKKNMNWGGQSSNGWKLRSRLASCIAVQNRDMISNFYPKEAKAIYLTRGVDTGEFYPRPADQALYGELCIDPASPVILNVANMVPVKGIDLLVRAFALMSHNNATLVLVGDDTGEYGHAIHHLVHELGIGNRVVFTGKRLDVARFLSIATVFVLCTQSKGEGSPVALLEAMASGVPVVGTAIPGIKDQLVDFPDLLVAPGNEQALANKLSDLLSMNEGSLSELKNNLVGAVQNFYNLRREIREHEQLYKKCLNIN